MEKHANLIPVRPSFLKSHNIIDRNNVALCGHLHNIILLENRNFGLENIYKLHTIMRSFICQILTMLYEVLCYDN